MAEAWAKLVVGCDPDGPRYLEDEPCKRKDCHFGLNLGASEGVLGAFLIDFGTMAGEWKTLKNLRFSLFFCTFGVLGRGG